MIYSGADLIRTSGQQQDRLERLRLVDSSGVEPVGTPENPASGLDDNTQSALMRFARFIHKDKKEHPQRSQQPRKPASSMAHPYLKQAERWERLQDEGRLLNLYI